MKKIILLALFGLSISFNIKAQKIKEDKVDDFTHSRIITTSWERLFVKNMGYLTAEINIRKINGDFYLQIAMMHPHVVFGIPTEPGVMFILDNDSVIVLQPIKHVVSSNGGGARGGFSGSNCLGEEIHCLLTVYNIHMFKTHDIKKYRCYTTDGYIEDEINERNRSNIKNCLNLFK